MIDDGGRAFPGAVLVGVGRDTGQPVYKPVPGMSLRVYIAIEAAKALLGLRDFGIGLTTEARLRTTTKTAFMFADMMIAHEKGTAND